MQDLVASSDNKRNIALCQLFISKIAGKPAATVSIKTCIVLFIAGVWLVQSGAVQHGKFLNTYEVLILS